MSTIFRSKHHWGPFLWGLIHTTSIIDFETPEVQRRITLQALDTLRSVANCIPCKGCSNHYLEYVNRFLEQEQDLYKRMRLFEYMVEFHNQVNHRLNKPEITLEQAKEEWTRTILSGLPPQGS